MVIIFFIFLLSVERTEACIFFISISHRQFFYQIPPWHNQPLQFPSHYILFFWREIWKRWWSEQIIDLFRDFGELINSTRSDPVRDEWSQVRFSLSCSRYLLFALQFLFTFIFQMVYVKYVKYLCNDRVWEQFVEKKQNNLKSSSTNEKGNLVFNRESKAKREKKHLLLFFSFLPPYRRDACAESFSKVLTWNRKFQASPFYLLKRNYWSTFVVDKLQNNLT